MKKVIRYIISINDYLNTVFKIIPSNAFIDKGRCGVGGTTLELRAHRHSIIIVPTTGIIKNKLFGDHKQKDEERDPLLRALFGIYKGVSINMIMKELNSQDGFIKIMVTPDSFRKIVVAATKLNMLEKLFDEFFVLLDECHTSITEKFRKEILSPYKYIWNFKNKSFISATPFYFSDKRIQSLEHYQIQFKEPYLGSVRVVNTSTVKSCVNFMLTNLSKVPGNLHIFYNSVTEIAEAIRLADLKDCNVHFADKDANKETMDEYISFFKPEPIDGEYKKVNFYTAKYFEGMDIYDKDASIILVTDACKPHTKVGIRNKGVQAIGRLRNKPYVIYHITNHRFRKSMKTLDFFDKDHRFHAQKLIENYNNYSYECLNEGKKPKSSQTEEIEKIADIENGRAILSDNKIDQYVNEDFCNEEFNNIAFIKYAWQEAGFNVSELTFNEPLKTSISKENRKSKAIKIQETIEEIEDLERDKLESFFNFNDYRLAEIKKSQPLAYKAYYILTKDLAEKLGYNEKKIKKELTLRSNQEAKKKLERLIKLEFKTGEISLNESLKSRLQQLYDHIEYKKVATATQLSEWFNIKYVKRKVNNEWINCCLIESEKLNLKVLD